MPVREEAHFYTRPDVYGIEFIRATFITHSFARHVHDYYAIGVIEEGVQTFTARGGKLTTPPSSVFLINPDEPHTGEPATSAGFTYSTFYPTTELLQGVASEMAGKPQPAPYFAPLVVTDPALTRHLLELHALLSTPASALEGETRLLKAFAYMIKRYADSKYPVQAVGKERTAVRLVRDYLQTHFGENTSLTELAGLVNLSPFYLTRVFQSEVGLPPHSYLESIRVGQAQKLLALGHSLATVALEVGYCDQSHFTHRFKRMLGITPRQFVIQRKILQDFRPC